MLGHERPDILVGLGKVVSGLVRDDIDVVLIANPDGLRLDLVDSERAAVLDAPFIYRHIEQFSDGITYRIRPGKVRIGRCRCRRGSVPTKPRSFCRKLARQRISITGGRRSHDPLT